MMAEQKQVIPEGYKQTEVGVIPQQWAAVQLKEVFVLKNGYSFKGEFFSNTGPIVLTPGNFKLDGGLYFEERNTKRYSGDYPDGFEFKTGDLVIVMTDLTPDCNLLGKPAFVKEEERVLHNQRIGKIEKLAKDWDLIYLYYTLLSPIYLSTIKNAATGSTVRHTSPKTIANAWVVLPSKKEQTIIANALSDVDALISELEKFIAKKQAIKTATMQQLLTGKTRLPEFALREDGTPKGYKVSELGEIPVDWEIESLGNIFKITAGGDLRKKEFSIIKTDTNNHPIFSNAISDKGIYGYSSTYDYDGEHLTITARGGIGHAVSRYGTFCAIGRLLVLKPISCFSCKFFEEYINQYLEFASESTGVPQLTAPQVAKYIVVKPSFEEQIAIAINLSDMDEEIQSLQQRLNKTRQIKQGMMQELLTGKTRLVKPEVTA